MAAAANAERLIRKETDRAEAERLLKEDDARAVVRLAVV